MRWLENLRQQPTEKKLRFIWTVVIVVVIILLVFWILTSKIGKVKNSDTTFFRAISNSFKQFFAQ